MRLVGNLVQLCVTLTPKQKQELSVQTYRQRKGKKKEKSEKSDKTDKQIVDPSSVSVIGPASSAVDYVVSMDTFEPSHFIL